MNNNKKAIVVLDDFFGDDKLTHDMSAREAWDCIKGSLKEQEAKSVIFDRQCEVLPGHWERKGFCPKCHQVVLWMVNREYCGFCGQKVKWNERSNP